MTAFAELTRHVHLLNDLILSDMICGVFAFISIYIIESNDTEDDTVMLSKHLLATKYWFARISYANKKRYLLALLHDVRSAWTLSLLLKSLWNCRLKDAVISVSERGGCLSSYDQAPMDHNRTALPLSTLAQVMKNDRLWFLSLDPESQALVLSELLTVSGGPAMWEILHRARILYDRYSDQMMANMQECTVQTVTNQSKPTSPTTHSTGAHTELTKAEKALAANLGIWNATIKSLRDNLKLEEFEMTSHDGTKSKVWKVNRPKPDIVETVDFVQLLPSAIGKLILSFLPQAHLSDYARVNKYWAYLVDEFRSELAAIVKINADFIKMNDILHKHDLSLNEFVEPIEPHIVLMSEPEAQMASAMASAPYKQGLQSCKASEKSFGAYSLRNMSEKMLSAKALIAQKPLRNLAELNERVQLRGATDEHIWKWCENIEQHIMNRHKKGKQLQTTKIQDEEGILLLGNVHFPCPLMKLSIVVPLKPPLYKDPAKIDNVWMLKRRTSATGLTQIKEERKRRHLWIGDVSPLYPVFKIPSYYFPTFN